MRFYTLLFFLLLLYSCHHNSNKNLFKEFDFTYSGFKSTYFSIKFTDEDTVFVAEYPSPLFADSPMIAKNYFAIISPDDRQKINNFLSAINFAKYDTSYYESYKDGHEYKYYISNDSTTKSIYIHSYTEPKELRTFADFIVSLKKKSRLSLLNSKVDYKSHRNFYPPEVPPSTIVK